MAVAVRAKRDLLLVVASAVPQGRGVIELQDFAVFVSRVATLRASVPVLFKDALALARRGPATLVLDQSHDDGFHVAGEAMQGVRYVVPATG